MLSQDDTTPCTLLLKVSGELMDVAKGSVVKPLDPIFHFNPLPADQFRVSVDSVLPGCEKMDPPSQPPGSDREMELSECPNWPLLWPKALIRLDALEVDGSAPPNPANKVTPPAPPVLESPVEPAVTTKKKRSPILSPGDLGLDDRDDNDALMDDLDPITEVDPIDQSQTAVPDLAEDGRATKRRLFDPASQHTPDAVPFFTEDQRPDVLSPNTLLNATVEAVKGDLVQPLGQTIKKGRKRHPARKKGSSSQPAPSQIVMDKIPTNLRPIHVLGKPILPESVLKTMTGEMVALHELILYEEQRLMAQDNPSYPLFIAKVPKGFGFVDTSPGDAVFLRFDDLFNMFHIR